MFNVQEYFGRFRKYFATFHNHDDHVTLIRMLYVIHLAVKVPSEVIRTCIKHFK